MVYILSNGRRITVNMFDNEITLINCHCYKDTSTVLSTVPKCNKFILQDIFHNTTLLLFPSDSISLLSSLTLLPWWWWWWWWCLVTMTTCLHHGHFLLELYSIYYSMLRYGGFFLFFLCLMLGMLAKLRFYFIFLPQCVLHLHYVQKDQ